MPTKIAQLRNSGQGARVGLPLLAAEPWITAAVLGLADGPVASAPLVTAPVPSESSNAFWISKHNSARRRAVADSGLLAHS